jgi:hypothetical protein
MKSTHKSSEMEWFFAVRLTHVASLSQRNVLKLIPKAELKMNFQFPRFVLLMAITFAFSGCGDSEPVKPTTSAPTATASKSEPVKTTAGSTSKKGSGANKIAPNADEDPRARRNKANQ